MSSPAAATATLVIALGMLTIAILSLVGLGYLTNFSFNAVASGSDGQTRTINMTDTQVNLSRMTVVLLWIQLALAIIAGIMATRK